MGTHHLAEGDVSGDDVRQAIPRTDHLLALPEVESARAYLSDWRIRQSLTQAQQQARDGLIDPADVQQLFVATIHAARISELRPVVNATGIIVHTNLGRAPLSDLAIEALVAASGYVNVEFDLQTGGRSARGRATTEALLAACPDAEDALVVNNAAAALLLATTALAGTGEVLISRGELIEIGAGFRLTDLIESAGARLREVGTTNRTHLRDYADALSEQSGCILKVHPSNYRITGFTAEATVAQLHGLSAAHGIPLVVDQGSGLLAPDPALPVEPDVSSALRAGADVVIASGDKLLGGPQSGLILGRADVVRRLATHPLARALRIDKLRLAALEATLIGAETPVAASLHADPVTLERRTRALADAVRADVIEHDGRVGGGGAPGVELPGWAVRLPEKAAAALRQGHPPVLTRVHAGDCLLDLRCVESSDDKAVLAALRAALEQ